jgi:fumarate reductase flavoprotein subunit
MCRSGRDTQYGRASFEDIVTVFEGPYYASPRQPAVHHTMGGVEVDGDCHVLRADGSVIRGLYAAGEVTGGIHGTNRVGANAIPDALANGRAAGENAFTGK